MIKSRNKISAKQKADGQSSIGQQKKINNLIEIVYLTEFEQSLSFSYYSMSSICPPLFLCNTSPDESCPGVSGRAVWRTGTVLTGGSVMGEGASLKDNSQPAVTSNLSWQSGQEIGIITYLICISFQLTTIS